MGLATIEDFTTRHGAVDDTDRVGALLTDASALILQEVAGSAEEWVTTPETAAPQAVVSVCVEAAYRAFSNPDGLSRTEVGDVAAYYRPGSPPDAIFLTRYELRIVRRAAGLSSFRSVTMETPFSGTTLVGIDPDDPDA